MKCHTLVESCGDAKIVFVVQARGLPIRPLTSWYDLTLAALALVPKFQSTCKVATLRTERVGRQDQQFATKPLQPLCNRFATALQPLCNRFATAISIFQLPSVPRCSVHVSRPSQQNPSDPVPRHASLPTPESTENGRWMRIVKENMSNMSRLTSTEPDFTTRLYHDVLGSIAFAANARLMT